MTRKDRFFLILFWVLPACFLSGTILSGHTFFARDLTYLFHPWRTLAAQMVQAGAVPLWNSYEMGGMPFLANCQSAVFYPFTIFFYCLEFVWALKIFYLFHYALAATGFYLLCRKMGFSSAAAFIGGVLYAFNGYMLTRLEFLSVLGSILWLPWILLPVLSSASAPKRSAEMIVAGIACSFLLFSGYPQIFLLSAGAAFFFALLAAPGKRTLWFGAGVLLILVLVSAAQWLPTMELLSQSIRGGKGVDFTEAATYSLPADGLFGLVFPFRILHNTDRFTGEKYFWIWSAWWGFIASGLALLSLKCGRKRLLAFGWIMAAAGLLWSMGSELPWYPFLYQHVFFLKLFRYPPVALFWTVSAVSFLAVCGASFIEQKLSGASRAVRFSVLFLAGLLIAAELQVYSRQALPTTIHDYFSVTFPSVEALLKERPGAVMLSPKTERERKLPGMSDFAARLKFRAYLFDLTNLPYRIKTLMPSGEPLALSSFSVFYAALTRAGSLKDARPTLDLWNVTHFLTEEDLDPSWERIPTEGDHIVKVYRNPEALGECFAFDRSFLLRIPEKKNVTAPVSLECSNDRVRAFFETAKDLDAAFSVPEYPGWKIFCADCGQLSAEKHARLTIQRRFIGAALPKGAHHLTLYYQPFLWPIALALSIAGLILVLILFLKDLASHELGRR